MISQSDLELLNAYIDGALDEEERTELEMRLESEPVLRRELEGLRATAELIRALPALRSPRDLSVSPRIARRTQFLIFPAAAISLVSAAASIILIVIGIALLNPSSTLLNAAQQSAVSGAVSNMDAQENTATVEEGVLAASLPTVAALPTQKQPATQTPQPTLPPVPDFALPETAPIPSSDGSSQQASGGFAVAAPQEPLAQTAQEADETIPGAANTASDGFYAMPMTMTLESTLSAIVADVLTNATATELPAPAESARAAASIQATTATLRPLATATPVPSPTQTVSAPTPTNTRADRDNKQLELTGQPTAVISPVVLIIVGVALGVFAVGFTLWSRRRR